MEDETYIAEKGITIRFGGMTFNAFIITYLSVALANAPSLATLTTLSNIHSEISILKMRSISWKLWKNLFHFVDCMFPKIILRKETHTCSSKVSGHITRVFKTWFLSICASFLKWFLSICASFLRYLVIFLILNKFYSYKNHQKNHKHEID